MGTRADFYIGQGEAAEWIGSVAYDGYPSGIPDEVLCAADEGAFRQRVCDFVASKKHGTTAAMGWPWPWRDSRTTDYAYAILDEKVRASRFGGPWFDPTSDDRPGPVGDAMSPTFPDMTSVSNVTYGERSGAMFLTVRTDE